MTALTCVELPVEEPRAGQLRVRVRAAGVGATDLMVMAGTYRYAPKLPVVPGYEIAGGVDAIGPGVTGFTLGQRVAALTVHGGFAEVDAQLRRRRGAFYGITMLYRKDPAPLREDLPRIFALIAEKKLDPLVSMTLPLVEAKAAIQALVSGAVEGKIVLTGARPVGPKDR